MKVLLQSNGQRYIADLKDASAFMEIMSRLEPVARLYGCDDNDAYGPDKSWSETIIMPIDGDVLTKSEAEKFKIRQEQRRNAKKAGEVSETSNG